MKKSLMALLLLGMTLLPACGAAADGFTGEQRQMAIDVVAAFFESNAEREFAIGQPVSIEGADCLTVTVSGRYGGGAYPLDTFAVSPEGTVYYQTPDGGFEHLRNLPWYACAVSPDGRLCMEGADIAAGSAGPSGIQVLGAARMIDMETAEVLWQDSGYMQEKYLWSGDSRYVARQISGRTWTGVSVIDAQTLETITFPNDGILAAAGLEIAGPSGHYEFTIAGWTADNALEIGFGWYTEAGSWVQGSGRYLPDAGAFELAGIEEAARG